MTELSPVLRDRRAGRRTYLMCPPTYFDVSYRINPWMDPEAGRPDRPKANEEWGAIVAAYRAAGHHVVVADPAPGLPDLVFTANAGLVIDGRVLVSRFRHPERVTEALVAERWFRELGFREIGVSATINEGEGDFLPAGELILAASGFRTELAAHAEVTEFFGRRVVSLDLVDDRLYHLDTALAVLTDDLIAYWPEAFSVRSQGVLSELFSDAVIASEDDALTFGLNACSDGRRVVIPRGASGLGAQLADRGFEVVPVDTRQLQKAGGAAKCCTLELRC